jgi:Cellulase (glycosyl hydrolase family 5)/Glycosyl transferase family 2
MLTLGPFTPARKLNAGILAPWQHHRGGWKFVCRLIAEHLHCEDGVRFIGSVEDEVAERRIIAEPWVGFIHQVPKHNLQWFPDLERLLKDEYWKARAQYCLGLFVLSTYVKDYLQSAGCEIPVARILYPAEPTDRLFAVDRFFARSPRRIVSGGEFLRNFQPFFDLKAPGFSKQLLVHEGFKWQSIVPNNSVELLGRVSDDEYDALLEDSVVFLNLRDAPANTTVVECIVRNTPILINPLPGVVEYLGEDYPYYYSSLEEAEAKLQRPELIHQTFQYLSCSPVKPALTGESFLAALQNSAIYRSLPTPASQPAILKRYDASVVICSYKRVYNMDALLEAFTTQAFAGSFEVLVWNNNYEARQQIDDLYEKYKSRIDLKVIHSTENFYCVIRLAIASLIRSDFILICDDDVKPLTGYISLFMEKAKEYPDSVLCCRGHVFKPHVLNEEEPQRFWTDYEHLAFFDESKSDREVHFLHADNCLIPKRLMQKALDHPMERYEFRLIDDYWLSFVFSHVLKVPIWKIKATDVLSFAECADDPGIALYHNPRVIEQRTNFYIHHMRMGWPFGAQSRGIATHEQMAGRCSTGKKSACWDLGFGGVNMFSETDEADFASARAAGITVVRFGAVGDAQDFRYLMDAEGEHSLVREDTINRLAAGIQRAADHGISVIIALGHVPGRIFAQEAEQYDFRLWCSPEYGERFAALWGTLARTLRHFENVVGYDLLNEPFTPDDVAQGYFDEMPSTYVGTLNEVYRKAITAIREWDSETPIILESTYWASPRTLKFLQTYDDKSIVYSFHMYAPLAYTMRGMNRSRFAYPGPVKKWPDSKWGDSMYWDRETIRAFLELVRQWQLRHQIADRNIFVGECGVSREVAGAERYLFDVLEIFREFKWNWAAFAFRDAEWDAMNYELGTDIQTMLPGQGSAFFDRLTRYFK